MHPIHDNRQQIRGNFNFANDPPRRSISANSCNGIPHNIRHSKWFQIQLMPIEKLAHSTDRLRSPQISRSHIVHELPDIARSRPICPDVLHGRHPVALKGSTIPQGLLCLRTPSPHIQPGLRHILACAGQSDQLSKSVEVGASPAANPTHPPLTLSPDELSLKPRRIRPRLPKCFLQHGAFLSVTGIAKLWSPPIPIRPQSTNPPATRNR